MNTNWPSLPASVTNRPGFLKRDATADAQQHHWRAVWKLGKQ